MSHEPFSAHEFALMAEVPADTKLLVLVFPGDPPESMVSESVSWISKEVGVPVVGFREFRMGGKSVLDLVHSFTEVDLARLGLQRIPPLDPP